MARKAYNNIKQIINEVYRELLSNLLLESKLNTDDALKVAEVIGKYKQLEDVHQYKISPTSDGRWMTEIADDTKVRGSRQIRAKSKNELLDKLLNHYGCTNKSFTEAFHEWIAYSKQYKALDARSIRKYKTDFRKHLAKSPIAEKPIQMITAKEVTKLLKNMLEKQLQVNRPMRRKDYSNVKSVIKRTFEHATTELEIDCDAVVHRLSNTKFSQRYFKEEVKRDEDEVFLDDEVKPLHHYLVKQIKSFKTQKRVKQRMLMFLFMFETGIRIGEAVALKLDDVSQGALFVTRMEGDEEDSEGKIKVIVKDKPKTDESCKPVILNENALRLWEMMTENHIENPDGYILWCPRHLRVFTAAFRKQWKDICEYASVPYKPPHKVRKTYCSELFNQGVDPKLIQRQMRHSDFSLTANTYAHLDTTGMNESANAIANALSVQKNVSVPT